MPCDLVEYMNISNIFLIYVPYNIVKNETEKLTSIIQYNYLILHLIYVVWPIIILNNLYNSYIDFLGTIDSILPLKKR